MLAEVCPSCGTPLFKTGDSITCPTCNRTVKIVRGVEEETRFLKAKILEDTEQMLLKKVNEIQMEMQKEKDPEVVRTLTESLTGLLNALQKLRHDQTL